MMLRFWAQKAATRAEASKGADGLDVSENWARLDEVIAKSRSFESVSALQNRAAEKTILSFMTQPR